MQPRKRAKVQVEEEDSCKEERSQDVSLETHQIKVEPQQHSEDETCLEGQKYAEEEEGEEDPVEESDTFQALQAVAASSSKAKVRKVVDFDSDQEEELVEWFQSHPEMYDHNQKAYKRTDYKNRLLQDKAESMGVLSQDIMTWYRTQRTAFSRLMSKGGNPKKPQTFRSQWVNRNFQFLAPHLRIRSHNTSYSELPENSRDSSDTEVPVEAPATGLGAAPAESKSQLDDVLMTLAERLGNRESELTRIEEALKANAENRRTWAMWLGGEVQDFNEEEWLEFSQEVSVLLYKYKRQVLMRRQTQQTKPGVQ